MNKAHGLSTQLMTLLSLVSFGSTGCLPPKADKDVPLPDGCFVQRFKQPDSVTQAVDLLFVTDTSGSMLDEKLNIAQGIDEFIEELPCDTDLNISVMPAHGSKSSYAGKLWGRNPIGPVLSTKKLFRPLLRLELAALLTIGPTDLYSDGGEEGMYSLLRGLADDRLSSSRTKGFFRQDAALAVVFIADENDICANYPDGVVPVRDPDNREGPAKTRDCSGVNPDSVLNKLKSVQGGRPLVVSGILYDNVDSVPRRGENEYGYGYMDLIGLNKGLSVDMARGNYERGLRDIAGLVKKKITTLHDFKLDRTDVDVSSIKVYVDGKQVAFTYDVATNSVHVEDAGAPRSVVDVSYCSLPPAPLPSSMPSPNPSESPAPEPSPMPSSMPSPNPSESPAPECPAGDPTCDGGVIGS